MGKKSKTIIGLVCPVLLLGIAGWIWLAPGVDEINAGTAEPEYAEEFRTGMATNRHNAQECIEERAKSMDWVSSEWVVWCENHIKVFSQPVMYFASYTMGRIIEKKIGVGKGFKFTLLTLAIGIPLMIVAYACGVLFLMPHLNFSHSPWGMVSFHASILAGCLCGLAELLQLAMKWFLIPAVMFLAVAVLVILVCIWAVIDLFTAKFWTPFLVAGCVYGFVVGVFISVVLTMFAVLAICAIAFCAGATTTFEVMKEPFEPKKAELSDGTVITRKYGDTWQDDSGREYTNIYGDTFERRE